MKDLTTALNNIDMTYDQLVEMANDIVSKCTKQSDEVIKSIRNNIENLTNDDIRVYMAKLSLTAYSFSEIKEKSTMKAECAEVLRKEAYATEFGILDGSVAAKDNQATLNISEEILTETMYNLVSSILKSKLDELHRVVDTLKTIIMSRLSEAKLTYIADNGQE